MNLVQPKVTRWFFTTSLFRSPDFQNVAKHLPKTQRMPGQPTLSRTTIPPPWETKGFALAGAEAIEPQPKRWGFSPWRSFPMKGEMIIFSIGGLELEFRKIESKLMLGYVNLHFVVVFFWCFPITVGATLRIKQKVYWSAVGIIAEKTDLGGFQTPVNGRWELNRFDRCKISIKRYFIIPSC